MMATSINAINVDEEDTIDLSEYHVDQQNGDQPRADAYDKTLCQDNKDFTNFINKCLLLEQTFEMEAIIQKVLLPAYVCADDEYKKSENFTRVIKKAIQRLIDEPMKKYSHINDVKDTLRFHVKKLPKKRVNFVTLSTTSELGKIKEDSRKRLVVDNKHPKKSKKPKFDVIAVDSEEEEDDDVIPVDDTAKEVDDDLVAVEDTGRNTVGDVLNTVGDTGTTSVAQDLLDAHYIAKKIFESLNPGSDNANEMEVDSEVIAVDGEKIEGKFDNSVATSKPKKIEDHVKVTKSKHKLAAMFEPKEKSYKESSVKIKDTKLKESKETYSPNSPLHVENDTNTPIEILDSQEIKTQEEKQINNDESNTIMNIDSPDAEMNEGKQHDKENLDANDNLRDSNIKLLVPRMEIALEENKLNEVSDAAKKYDRIKVIEAEIEKCKKQIADLEVEEVTEDSSVSAYIRCDRLQAHIVKLYKELCTLNNAEPMKGRQVRLLHLAEGIPEGPVRRLEKFLNKQVDEEGVAPFPDFADVVRCIEKSNVKDGLGWSKAKVHKEAHALFECCGRALQRRRQRREWKDLRTRLPREAFDADPAAGDPELAAKLDLNRQLALKREADILDKFSRMEATSLQVNVQNEDKTQDACEPESSCDEEEKAVSDTPKINETSPVTETPEEPQTNGVTGDETLVHIKQEDYENVSEEQYIRIKEEPYEVPIESCFKLNVSIAIEISDSDSSDDDDVYSYVE